MDWKPFLGLPLWGWLFVFPSLFAVVCLLLQRKLHGVMRPIWRMLDTVFTASGVLAACCMVFILVVIVVQMVFRWFGLQFQGASDYAGYAMAATSFFALAHALNRGAHIRVSILLNMNSFTKKWMNVFALYIASLTATYFARYAIKTNFMSEMINDRTQGIDQVPERLLAVVKMVGSAPSEWKAMWDAAGTEWIYTPMWLPQIPMSIGTVLLAIAMWDNLYRVLVTGVNPISVETVDGDTSDDHAKRRHMHRVRGIDLTPQEPSS